MLHGFIGDTGIVFGTRGGARTTALSRESSTAAPSQRLPQQNSHHDQTLSRGVAADMTRHLLSTFMYNVGASSAFPLRCCCGARHAHPCVPGGWRRLRAPAGAVEAVAGCASAWHRPCGYTKRCGYIWPRAHARFAAFGCVLVAGGGGEEQEQEQRQRRAQPPPPKLALYTGCLGLKIPGFLTLLEGPTSDISRCFRL